MASISSWIHCHKAGGRPPESESSSELSSSSPSIPDISESLESLNILNSTGSHCSDSEPELEEPEPRERSSGMSSELSSESVIVSVVSKDKPSSASSATNRQSGPKRSLQVSENSLLESDELSEQLSDEEESKASKSRPAKASIGFSRRMRAAARRRNRARRCRPLLCRAAVHESASSTAFLVENLGNKSQHNPKRNGAVKIMDTAESWLVSSWNTQKFLWRLWSHLA
ncbi:hypothetical protein B0H13DRAFT_1913249 [Mycena leptocephala]|nr:hypothetical protein B0H13DRAFT_1913249 [Mycena leptocephala]